MSERAIKNTFIKFGLISIPVKLTTLQQKEPYSFHNLCPYCKSQIRYKKWCDNCQKEISHKEMLKGYRVSKSNIIILTQAEINALKQLSDSGIEILGFVDQEEIPFYLIEKTYNLLPQVDRKGKVLGLKAFCLFKEVLKLSNLVAIGKMVMRNKEYLISIRFYQDRLFLSILYYPHRISFGEKYSIELKEQEIKLGLEYISNLKTTFLKLREEGKTLDRFLERMRELLMKKVELKVSKPIKEQVEDLKDSLEKSIELVKKKKEK